MYLSFRRPPIKLEARDPSQWQSPMATPVQNFRAFLYQRTQEYIRHNDIDIIAAAKDISHELMERIDNFRHEKMTEEERKTISMEEIRLAIIENPVVRAHFRKDPSRQSIHENTQIEWLQRFYPDAKKMLAARGGTYFDDNGNLKTDTPRPATATKTLDVIIPSKNVMAVLKYTTTEGGAQDNQFRDVKHFLKQIGYHFGKPSPWTFHFYLDGPYYTEKRMDELRSLVQETLRDKILITSVASLQTAN